MKNKKLPFNENKLKNFYVREFSCSLTQDQLKWHQDEEDRIIELISGDNWYLQLDDSLPQKIIEGKKYFIPKLSWHRLIKGSSNLIIKLEKMEDSK